MPATIADAPTNELGYAAGVGTPVGPGQAGSGFTIDYLERTPELVFPASATVFDLMRKTDGQLGGVRRAITLPLLSARWRLVGEGIPAERIAAAEAEFGIGPANDARARRRRQGIVWLEHLRDALLALDFGFMPFEQTYTVAPPGPGQENAGLPRLVAHVHKLAPRHPRTLLDVRVDAAGGLAGIVQAPRPGAVGDAVSGQFIGVDRLVFYCPEREGADWTGTSIYRTAYKHWLIKDALLRLGPMVVERNGMGVPVVTYPAGGDEAKALRLAKAFRAGSDAGGALEDGYSLTLVGVTGTTKDELPLVKYHDEAAGRSLLTMFLNLGHDNGARALGDTFVDFFLLCDQFFGNSLGETFTEHVVRDWWELNYGADEPYPVLRCDDLSADAIPNVDALVSLAGQGLITGDDPLEADLRRRLHLPAADPATARVNPATTPAPGGAGETFQPAGVDPAEGPPSVIPIDTAEPGADPAEPGPIHVPAHTRRRPTAASDDDDLTDRLEAVTARIAALRARAVG